MNTIWLQKLRKGLAHAFGTEPEEMLSEEELALLEKVAGFVVRKGMATPAVLFLESMRPLNFVGSQVMVFLQPIVASFFSTQEYEQLANVLERRESIGLLIGRIEERQEKESKCQISNVKATPPSPIGESGFDI